MWRGVACTVLMIGAASRLSAQGAPQGLTSLRVGAGVNSADYSCPGCRVDAMTGFTGLLAASRGLGRVLTAGFEATLSRASGVGTDVRLVGTLATLGARSQGRLPLWGTAGLGWLWYSGTGPKSNGPALSARLGVDIPVAARVALSPYAGLFTMLGHDGPRTLVGPILRADDPGVATRVSSLQFGLAVTVTP